METQVQDIAKLNDRFRGMCLDVFYTAGVRDGIMDLVGLSQAVENFNNFNENNDPHGEHDFGSLKFEGKKIEPLLNDKPRTMVYIQSSGGNVPWMLRPILNKGLNYVEDIIKFMGIKKFEELLVDDTGFTEEEEQEAINKAYEKIDDIIVDIRSSTIPTIYGEKMFLEY